MSETEEEAESEPNDNHAPGHHMVPIWAPFATDAPYATYNHGDTNPGAMATDGDDDAS